MSDIKQAQAAYQDFTRLFESIILSTVDEKGQPNASYAPFVEDDSKSFYIFVSDLSTHTRNLSSVGKGSIMFIEDESKSQQIFARRRLTFDCIAKLITRETEEWNQLADLFEKRFGELIGVFRNLADFRIFKLTPTEGRFVVGFGAAYKISGDDLNNLTQIKGGGHGNK